MKLARSAELACDVEHNNTAVSNAAGKLDFNDEPVRVIALLSTHAQPRMKRT